MTRTSQEENLMSTLYHFSQLEKLSQLISNTPLFAEVLSLSQEGDAHHISQKNQGKSYFGICTARKYKLIEGVAHMKGC